MHCFLRWKCKGREATAAAGIGPIPAGPMHSAISCSVMQHTRETRKTCARVTATFTPDIQIRSSEWNLSDISAKELPARPLPNRKERCSQNLLQLCICISLHESCDAETFLGKSGVCFKNMLRGQWPFFIFFCVMVCIVIGTLNS